MIQNFKLINKINLTPNVYEMVFEGEKELIMQPGQFVTFLLENIGGRAYSILNLKGNRITLIIKKRGKEEGGRGGSKLICELNNGDILRGVGPAGHFGIKNPDKNKMFISTGTGLVPIYNMISSLLKNNTKINIKLVFGVRLEEDIFYVNQLKELRNTYPNFNFSIYISRVKDLHNFRLKNGGTIINSGYTTNYLTKENVSNFEEFYICGAPTMIESTIEKLEKLGFKSQTDIFYEKY